MPSIMSKKKPGPEKQARIREAVLIPEELHAAMMRLVTESDPPADKSAVIRRALEQYLHSKGYWPPKD